jgi:hypothetical protein
MTTVLTARNGVCVCACMRHYGWKLAWIRNREARICDISVCVCVYNCVCASRVCAYAFAFVACGVLIRLLRVVYSFICP